MMSATPTKRALYLREWRKNNLQSARRSGLKWYYANRERCRKYASKWKRLNKQKVCEQSKRFHEKHREKIKAKQRARYASNKSDMIARQRQRRASNPEHYRLLSLKYSRRNKERDAAWQKQDREMFPEKYKLMKRLWNNRNREHVRAYVKSRRMAIPSVRIRHSISSRISKIIKRGHARKTNRTIELLGGSIETVRAHIESMWQPGMSWQNYGFLGWHIDHIKPCAAFDMTDQSQQKECFHYTNLQPLWWADNLSKSDKLNWIRKP